MNSNEKEDRYRVVKYRLVMILLVISFICFLFFEANKTIKMNVTLILGNGFDLNMGLLILQLT